MKGGHPERLGAAAMLVVFAVSFITHDWRVGSFYAGDAALDLLLTFFFVWMALTRDRWWPLIMSGVMGLTLVVYVADLTAPGLDAWAVMSARIGLGLLTMLTLLGGVAERWLAGERPVSELSVWRRAARPAGGGGPLLPGS